MIPTYEEMMMDAKDVLIVDDEPGVAEGYAALIRISGYSVVVALSPGQAREMFRLYRPQWLITDLVLQRESGDNLAVEFRELMPELKVIVMTAAGDSTVLYQAQRAQALQVLYKPIKDARLAFAPLLDGTGPYLTWPKLGPERVRP